MAKPPRPTELPGSCGVCHYGFWADTVFTVPPLQCGNERRPWYGQEVGRRDRCGSFRWDHREVTEEQMRRAAERVGWLLDRPSEEDE